MTPTDHYTDGYLLTSELPQYALFIIFAPTKTGYHVIRQKTHELVPILQLPHRKPFVESNRNSATALSDMTLSSYPQYRLKVREYARQFLNVIFDHVVDQSHEYYRSAVSPNILVIQIKIRDDFVLNPRESDLNVVEYPTLDQAYRVTVETLLQDE